jgi:ABC-type nitrate/sulfonate/bicarbonate transport system substrate-binding protein
MTTYRGTIRLEIFPGGGNLPIWIGQDKGWFAEAGLDVTVSLTSGSAQQLPNLIGGHCDLVLTLIDNVVAYREQQREIPVNATDLIGLMTIDTASLPTLIALPEVKNYQDLRGLTLSLDAMTTGYAFLLFEMLERGGLSPGDYRVESVGGALQRFEALQRRAHAGALFNSPFEAMLVEKGFTALDAASNAIDRYQGMTLAGRGAWIRQRKAEVVAFCSVIISAIDWLYESRNRDEALGILAAHVRDTPEAIEAAYSLLTDPKFGMYRKGTVDVIGISRVLAMRSKYGRPKKNLTDPYSYYDPSYLEAALGRS